MSEKYKVIDSTVPTFITSAAPTLTQLQIDLMLMIPQAAMHGIAQGIIQGISGGDAGQSFITAAISSVAAGGFAMIPGSFSKSIVGQSLFGSVAGGVTSRLQDGNFWEGAVIGLTVSLLNHAGKPLSKAIDRWLTKTTVAGIYGAGGKGDSGNPALETEVLKQGGKMFQSSWPWGNGDSEIIAYLKAGFEKGHRLIIYAHSRGGAAAVRIANDLFGMHITISEINLYDPVGLYGGGDLVFKYPNVMKVNNYYQRNPIDGILIWADNPFIGSPVSGNFQFPEINNVNYTGKFYSTGVLMSHLNITKYAINNP